MTKRFPPKFAHHFVLSDLKTTTTKNVLSNMLCVLTFFQNGSSQFCFRFISAREEKEECGDKFFLADTEGKNGNDFAAESDSDW